jgi:4-amino-4-deoxy-L-arabinose transferase-like glycosyltransferase
VSGAVIPRREIPIWIGALLAASLWIGVAGFTSADPDSALYAGLSARLSEQPVEQWVAPEWWGFWPDAQMTGYFREHPAGLLFLPAALARFGVPAEQAAYVAGLLAAMATVVLIGLVVSRLTSPRDARAVMLLVQLMPVAFIFRVRANHEYPMLVCLLTTLLGLIHVAEGRRWRGAVLVAAGLSAALLIKGVFVALVLVAAGAWITAEPVRGSRSTRVAQLIVVAAGVAVMAGVAALYDRWYVAVTGGSFWAAYWQRQLGPLDLATPLEGAAGFAGHLGFYVSRLLWHPLPWSAVLVWSGWRTRHRISAWWASTPRSERRGLAWVGLFSIAAILVLSPSPRFAERYAFSATHAVAAAGAVAAIRAMPAFGSRLRAFDARVPAPAAVLWALLVALRLGLGPWLPRW